MMVSKLYAIEYMGGRMFGRLQQGLDDRENRAGINLTEMESANYVAY